MLKILAITAVPIGCGPVGQAQAVRTWVSGIGDDANPCSRTAPCRTFAGAIAKTASSGEIDALDPGSYGGVTITKSIPIDGGKGAGWAAVSAIGTNGIIVSSGANDIVILRNISCPIRSADLVRLELSDMIRLLSRLLGSEQLPYVFRSSTTTG